ncbi:AAA family ATPase, partial [Chryseobacterium sp.]|uniref:AAA family ATPase n=1 Tax=Chryseobacterium sp. TaxID=1871047 RepID=UPI00289EE1C8
MKPIDILGLKNFRVFDNETGFFEEMSAINVLTGANSSGKSSVIKALQMIKNSIRGDFSFELDLTQQEHLLGDFENVLNSKDNRELSISLPFTFMGLTNFFITLGFVVQPEDTYKAKLRKIEVTDTFDKRNLFLFYYRDASESEIKEDAEEYQR